MSGKLYIGRCTNICNFSNPESNYDILHSYATDYLQMGNSEFYRLLRSKFGNNLRNTAIQTFIGDKNSLANKDIRQFVSKETICYLTAKQNFFQKRHLCLVSD